MNIWAALTCGVLVAAAAGCNKKQSDEGTASSSAPTPVGDQKVVDKKPVPETPAGPDPKLVERGAYIAKAGACVVCHTAIGPKGPVTEEAFAGGLELPDVGGTWRSPNITQSKGTGIGGWTDAQIAASIREGVRPDGSQLYVIMPYMHYNRLTDDDTKALVAFLRTIKPVEKVVAPNKDLKFPKIPAPKPANAPDVTSDPLKHGEYMATLMLCGHCHWTPGKNMEMSPDKMFSGGLPITLPQLGTGTLFTRNITSDPETGIGKWSEDQIATTIKTMIRPDGRPILGPMQFMQGQWAQLEDADLKAVATFIHALPPVKNKVPDSTFKPLAMGGPPPGDATPADAKTAADGKKATVAKPAADGKMAADPKKAADSRSADKK